MERERVRKERTEMESKSLIIFATVKDGPDGF